MSVKRALGGFVAPFRGVVMVVVWWAKVVTTPPNLDLVGAGPVGSHHGSYRCVRYRGGQIWGGHMGLGACCFHGHGAATIVDRRRELRF